MRSLCVAIFIIIEALAFGQGFNKRYDLLGNNLSQTGYGIEYSPEGYVVISSSYDVDSLAPDLYFFHYSVVLTAIDHDGNVLWEKRAYPDNHSAFAGWANCCDTIPGGGYVSGGTSVAIDGTAGIYLIRFNAQGDTLWTRVYGDPLLNHYWSGNQVKHTQDGGFLIVGITDAIGLMNGFALKTDGLGNEEWREIYPWTISQSEGLVSCALAPGGGYYIGGSRFHPNTLGDTWVLRTDPDGGVIWNVSWRNDMTHGPAHLTMTSDGHPVLAHWEQFSSTDNPISKPMLTKLDSADGSIIWERAYGPITSFTGLYGVKETATGDLIACGITEPNPGYGYKGLLLRTNSEGDLHWMFSYFYQDDVMNAGMGRFFDVLPTPEGGLIATGVAWSEWGAGYPPGYTPDTWVVKVDGNGCIIPGCNSVGIEEQATNLLDALRIWPNPVQSGGQVQVELDLPPSVQARDLQLTVVALDGKVVHRQGISPLLGRGAGGEGHSSTLQLPQLSSGLYHLHITNGSTWLTGGKLVVE